MAHILENALPAVAACAATPSAHALTSLVMPIREKKFPTLSPWARMATAAFRGLCPSLSVVEEVPSNATCFERAALEYRSLSRFLEGARGMHAALRATAWANAGACGVPLVFAHTCVCVCVNL